MNILPYGKQNISVEDVNAVAEVLKSNNLTQGPVVPNFEKSISNYCGAKRAVAANSATSALHLACMALNLRQNDWVWTSPITFVASANCAIYCGANVDFVDIDLLTYNMDINVLEEKLLEAEKTGKLPKIVIPVHMCGQTCEMDRIHALSIRFGFRVIEDASHAIGAKYKGEPVGNCRYSDITVFSFHPVKIITTGEGGIALTNDPALAAIMERLRSHGITRDPGEMTVTSEGPWFYQQIDLGFNYRMTEMQAALGISQLTRLDQFVAERQALADEYDRIITPDIAIAPWRHPDAYSSFHLYVVQLNLEALGSTQKEVFERLRSHGIMVNLHYIPVYRHPYYRAAGHSQTILASAESYYARAITLPLFPGLTANQQLQVVKKITSPVGHQTIF
jgi:UDP-4-amino-4,6-dideoxy-N-acetyl-beta-L-altrosamine transaminase